MLRSLVGSEMCIRDRYQRRVRGQRVVGMASVATLSPTNVSGSFDEDSLSITIETDTCSSACLDENSDELFSDYEDELNTPDNHAARVDYEHKKLKEKVPLLRVEIKTLRKENSKLKRHVLNHRSLIKDINRELAAAHKAMLSLKKRNDQLEAEFLEAGIERPAGSSS
eukprot:TRINITY_DN9914_c0_g1_i1.p1 TRINITY_DN9914_c0_g1~~TRINITY_DN9914_c0_g1_i1.p1  ORF type:complete len:168 (-),score=69.02 TRINITY_DN9914_c0_g1_i1:449-952(-)